MADIDGLLKLAHQQGANELRVAVGQAPRMFAHGNAKRLSIPAISESTLRALLEGILTTTAEQELRTAGSFETTYHAKGLGPYRVAFTAQADGFEAVFLAGAAANKPSSGPPAAPAPTAQFTGPTGHEPASATAPPLSVRPSLPQSDHTISPQLMRWLEQASGLQASDLHLAEGEKPWVRVHGQLTCIDTVPVANLVNLLPLGAALTERLACGEALDLGLDIPGTGRARAHVYNTDGGPVAALRLLPREAPSFAALNMPTSFDDLIYLPHGLVLLCGATGSGKSTTLAALAQEALQRRSIVLVSLEDPIEYGLTTSTHSLLRRRQIGRDVEGFASGLRDALRADPDVLMLGEIRDRTSIALALTAAETGHLVLASVHSRSAASAVERIVDVFPAEQQPQIRLQLAESLRAVVAQRLVRRRSGEGRVPAIELLRVNRAVASLIREGKTVQIATVLQSGRREGMLALERCLADLVQSGTILHEDATAAANDPDALQQFLKRAL